MPHLYNPLKSDFKCTLRRDDNTQYGAVMPAREISEWDVPTAKVLSKRLLDAIYFETNMTESRDIFDPRTIKEIEVEL